MTMENNKQKFSFHYKSDKNHLHMQEKCRTYFRSKQTLLFGGICRLTNLRYYTQRLIMFDMTSKHQVVIIQSHVRIRKLASVDNLIRL